MAAPSKALRRAPTAPAPETARQTAAPAGLPGRRAAETVLVSRRWTRRRSLPARGRAPKRAATTAGSRRRARPIVSVRPLPLSQSRNHHCTSELQRQRLDTSITVGQYSKHLGADASSERVVRAAEDRPLDRKSVV